MRRSRLHLVRPTLLLPALLGAMILIPSTAGADVGPPSDFRRSLELAIGPLNEGSLLEGDDLLLLALRATWRFSSPWALEASVGEHRDRRFTDAEATTAEVSVRRSLIRNDHVDFFVLGGAGYADGAFDLWLQPPGPFEIVTRERVEESGWTAHLGLGVEISLGERWFLRTELRERYLGDIELLDVVLDREATLAWGRRF